LWWLGEGAPDRHPPPPGRDPAAVAAMAQARRSVPPDAAARMAERLRQRGLAVTFTTLPGLGHGQTLGASLPPLLAQLSAADAEP
ncbi:MAG: hypothetical protein KBG34_09900, partial [Pseudoxanthomonas sp.]|nr:hypothetical protein [Pseudoxanthomonas sp.]